MIVKSQNLEVNTDLCTACRACELACHFHHQATFGTNASSIQVNFDGATGSLRIQIDSSCDRCELDTEPYCFHVCNTGAIQLG